MLACPQSGVLASRSALWSALDEKRLHVDTAVNEVTPRLEGNRRSYTMKRGLLACKATQRVPVVRPTGSSEDKAVTKRADLFALAWSTWLISCPQSHYLPSYASGPVCPPETICGGPKHNERSYPVPRDSTRVNSRCVHSLLSRATFPVDIYIPGRPIPSAFRSEQDYLFTLAFEGRRELPNAFLTG